MFSLARVYVRTYQGKFHLRLILTVCKVCSFIYVFMSCCNMESRHDRQVVVAMPNIHVYSGFQTAGQCIKSSN